MQIFLGCFNKYKWIILVQSHNTLFSAYQQKTSCENFIVHKSVIDIVTFQERAMDMEDYATVRRIKLEQCVQLATFKTDANQVSRWERNLENWIL